MNSLETLSRTHLHNGWLAIGHRPKLKRLPQLAEAEVTHVVTLLSEKEGARSIGHAVQRAGMEWIWLPLENGEPPGSEQTEKIRVLFAQLILKLKDGSGIYMHCSAGIHRTGMIAYAFLRYSGNSHEDSLHRLGAMRQHTAKGVGEHRICWGDQFTTCDSTEHGVCKETEIND